MARRRAEAVNGSGPAAAGVNGLLRAAHRRKWQNVRSRGAMSARRSRHLRPRRSADASCNLSAHCAFVCVVCEHGGRVARRWRGESSCLEMRIFTRRAWRASARWQSRKYLARIFLPYNKGAAMISYIKISLRAGPKYGGAARKAEASSMKISAGIAKMPSSSR